MTTALWYNNMFFVVYKSSLLASFFASVQACVDTGELQCPVLLQELRAGRVEAEHLDAGLKELGDVERVFRAHVVDDLVWECVNDESFEEVFGVEYGSASCLYDLFGHVDLPNLIDYIAKVFVEAKEKHAPVRVEAPAWLAPVVKTADERREFVKRLRQRKKKQQ